MGVLDDWEWQQDQSDYIPYTDTGTDNLMGGYGGYGDLGIGNPGSYGGETVLPVSPEVSEDTPLDFSSWLSGMAGNIGGASGLFSGKNLAGLLGAGISAYGANRQNQLTTENQKAHDDAVAALQAANNKYSSPLRLVNPRAAITPVARNGASEWFSNNRLPTYAEGGQVNGMGHGNNQDWTQYARGGAIISSPLAQVSQSYVRGGTSGQADEVPAALSHGEYIFDADSVASLGDGNNEAGAAKLDQMRANIRAHKRSAPPQSIPPKSKTPQAYLKGKNHG